MGYPTPDAEPPAEDYKEQFPVPAAVEYDDVEYEHDGPTIVERLDELEEKVDKIADAVLDE